MPTSPRPTSIREDNSARPAGSLPSWLVQAAATKLPQFLMTKRWYPAKDAGIPTVEPDIVVPFALGDLPAVVAVWRVTPPGQPSFRMFAPLVQIPEDQAEPAEIIAHLPAQAGSGDVLVEGFSVDPFVRAWIGNLMRADHEYARGAQLRTGTTNQLAQTDLVSGDDIPIRRSTAEQSNTSIRIGHGSILKVIRKLEEGVHPELEVGRFLSDVAGFEATPALLGWTELEPAEGALPITLSVLQAYVPNEGDGWSWVLDRLSGEAGGDPREEVLPQVGAWLAHLGQRTAEMHVAFSTLTDDPAFRSEPVQPEDVDGWISGAQAMARRAMAGIEASSATLPPDAALLAEKLLAHQDKLDTHLQRLLADTPAFAKTRHHGDYHLGQVLVADGDAVIVDFEGEPLRPLAERRAKHAALRDVAGMLRSIAYAAAAAARALPQGSADRRTGSGDGIVGWEAAASDTYLTAYLAAAGGAAGCPADPEEAKRVIRFFMLEKAFYEIAYELANRPDWVAIPLRGALALLDVETMQ